MSLPQFDALLDRDATHDCGGYGRDHVCVRIAAAAELPTRFGDFHAVGFWNPVDGKEHAAFVHGHEAIDGEAVPVRIHSECLTGDAIGSLRCDCRDQLEASLRQLAKMPYGILLYLRQEGRGIGLTNKIRAYALQDHGLDTVEANLALGFRDDERDYSIAAHMLDSLGVRSVRLMTNNPRKIDGLRELGVDVVDRIPLVMPANRYNRRYLSTKARKSGHLIDDPELEQHEPALPRARAARTSPMSPDAAGRPDHRGDRPARAGGGPRGSPPTARGSSSSGTNRGRLDAARGRGRPAPTDAWLPVVGDLRDPRPPARPSSTPPRRASGGSTSCSTSSAAGPAGRRSSTSTPTRSVACSTSTCGRRFHLAQAVVPGMVSRGFGRLARGVVAVRRQPGPAGRRLRGREGGRGGAAPLARPRGRRQRGDRERRGRAHDRHEARARDARPRARTRPGRRPRSSPTRSRSSPRRRRPRSTGPG